MGKTYYPHPPHINLNRNKIYFVSACLLIFFSLFFLFTTLLFFFTPEYWCCILCNVPYIHIYFLVIVYSPQWDTWRYSGLVFGLKHFLFFINEGWITFFFNYKISFDGMHHSRKKNYFQEFYILFEDFIFVNHSMRIMMSENVWIEQNAMALLWWWRAQFG